MKKLRIITSPCPDSTIVATTTVKGTALPTATVVMTNHRQKDYGATVVKARATRSQNALQVVIRKRDTPSILSSKLCMAQFVLKYIEYRNDHLRNINRRNRISSIDFNFNFNAYSELDCLVYFRFRKQHLLRLAPVLAWPANKLHTSRNRYAANRILATCVVLRRLAAPARWKDLEELFGKHGPQLSEIFWEALEHMLNAREHLVTTPICAEFIQPRLQTYASSIYAIYRTLPTCIGFIDGTVLGIARPKGNLAQRFVYNGHKRKHALKYQAINTPDGIIQHVYGPLEGRRHDWTLYIRSGLDEGLPAVLLHNAIAYCIYGDSGYNSRWYMEVPFQGATLSAAQKAFNTAMSQVRINVEWVFKEIKMHFATVDFKRKMKLFESPIGMIYMASMLLSNFRNCVYPNQISRYFNVQAPLSKSMHTTSRRRAVSPEEARKKSASRACEGAKRADLSAVPQGAPREEKLGSFDGLKGSSFTLRAAKLRRMVH